jgi:hypothetical protein
MAELVEYIRSKKYQEVVEEQIEIIYKKDADGTRLVEWIDKANVSNYQVKGKVDKKRSWVRLGRGRPIGVIVSNAPGSIGWSLVKHPDKFNKTIALTLARNREKKSTSDLFESIPYSIRNQVQILLEKSRKINS